ncbi:hypothetical protein BGW36DRAFT_153769 [Talaromyces proteolyticus]|uniref:Zn(2)-C6 fungal-type domain-containing protein n=1 Tax=Talaromyces proteolyticus TaxID=1131652 RepID=A0AAD4PX72_9EURO|nr:uncharacterized protein BGW36DRAFT_153769 [Talaromyces proteolyticus]KAH8699012.1 hypothetical protein BGW36DRAFT_153769 [Talaromyces proteolyticus]
MEARFATGDTSSQKRPRSTSGDFSPNVSKVPRTQSNHLHINYLARQYPDNLPLVSTEDSLPNILRLIGEYDGVLQRHESIAGNLGACPLGPILMKRFERLFEGPPRVLKSNGKEGINISWLDVVEFAKNKPDQFNLEKTRNGVRVCQFYTKQCRVEISEEDHVLIASGMPQKLIPPQPIDEDEEKEVGSLEILEKNLQQIIAMTDSAAARARQLNHRLESRRKAIITRRETDRNKNSQSPPLPENASPDNSTGLNGTTHPQSPPGFTAVNSNVARTAESGEQSSSLSSHFMLSHPNTENITIINGTNIKGASPATREELMKKFFTTADRTARGLDVEPASSSSSSSSLSKQASRHRPRGSDASSDLPAAAVFGSSAGPGTVAIPNTPSSLLPQPKPINHYERDDGGPFKMEMVARMDELQRGERILPPCDRCRRLHMDCLKNLTACVGCTKKHAKCSWKDVKEDELRDSQLRVQTRELGTHAPNSTETNNHNPHNSPDHRDTDHPHIPPSVTSVASSGRAESTSSVPIQSETLDLPPLRRTNSEIHAVMLNNNDSNPHNHDQGGYDRRSIHQRSMASHSNRDEDDNLIQAIRDTVQSWK